MSQIFHSDVARRVARSYDTLSPGHRRIADFILQNPAEAAMMSNVELASRCEVSTATATRFARAIGFSSFAEFHDSQVEALSRDLSHANRLSREIDEHASHYDIVCNGIDQDLANLKSTRERLDEETCSRAVELILGAERIFAFGAGVSQYVIGALIHGLEPSCRGNASNIGPLGDSNAAIRRVVHCREGDLLIVCSLPHYSAQTIEITQLARQRNASIICITDKPTSPLTRFADAVFYADTTRRLLPNSIAAGVAVAEGIVAAVANRRKESLDVHRHLDARHVQLRSVSDSRET